MDREGSDGMMRFQAGDLAVLARQPAFGQGVTMPEYLLGQLVKILRVSQSLYHVRFSVGPEYWVSDCMLDEMAA